jgi:GNAT superfamily N-acetyltransferase
MAVTVSLRKITEANIQPVLRVRTTPEQERFVSSIGNSIAEATVYQHANPWYRAVYADEEPVGFVMLSWDVRPQPPHVNGPWFLWKLLIDFRHQRLGYGQEVLRQVVELVRARVMSPATVTLPASTHDSDSSRPVTSTPTARSSCS